MNYTYLFVDLGLLLFSVLLFSRKQLNFASQSKFIILALLINVFAFSVPTEFLTQLKVIVYNPPYLSGMTLWELPAEELLLSFLLPLSGLAVYLFLNISYPDNTLEKYSLALSNIMLGVCIAMLYFGHQKLFTVFTFSILLVFLLYIEYVNKIRFMYRFYRAFLVSLILFYSVYSVLTSVPVIQYTTEETLNFNLSHIPFESHFYFMSMLLLSIYLFELFKSRARN
ncbi:MAG: lycopene cyclase domain-containing protein [Pedobacter sp.]|uniref:lycopene cyclase domain-containing protein n=1 Tax=Pedobacter sp. TaxID=1411316 RepID=UPI0033924989